MGGGNRRREDRLTDQAVRHLIAAWDDGVPSSALAERFGLTQRMIRWWLTSLRRQGRIARRRGAQACWKS